MMYYYSLVGAILLYLMTQRKRKCIAALNYTSNLVSQIITCCLLILTLYETIPGFHNPEIEAF